MVAWQLGRDGELLFSGCRVSVLQSHEDGQ